MSAEEFQSLPIDSIARSEDGKMLIVKRKLYWDILCATCGNPDNPQGRYLCITYNENYLSRVFGTAVNSYTNYVTGGDTIAKHFHKKFRELFRVESLTSPLLVTLKDPATSERAEFELDGRLIEFESKKWLREIIVPEGIAHKLHNPNSNVAVIAVTTSGQHDTDDVFSFEM